MTPFLQRTAERIVAEHGQDLANICVVLPSRRAATYLRNELNAQLNKPFWAPRFFNMQDLFSHFSKYDQLDPSEALFDLYKAYVDVKGTESADDLGTFLAWGPTLLRDINDVDNYLLDPIPFFTDLRNIKEIEDWSLGNEHLTKDQLRFTELWKEQGEIYSAFSQKTHQRGLATYGAMGRDISERIDQILDQTEIDKFWIAGMNALSKSESVLIKKLVRAGKAECLWDADTHYFDDPAHEAGQFQRKNRSFFSDQEFNWVSNNLRGIDKKIEVITTPNDLAQVQAASAILSELANQKDLENTVIVLPDQRLLIPLLMELPESIESFNITMGSPLKGTPVLDLLQSMISLHEKRARSGKRKYYHKDVHRILRHPLMLKAYSNLAQISSGNKAYLNAADLFGQTDEEELGSLKLFFEVDGDLAKLESVILQILKTLSSSSGLNVIEREFVLKTIELWERIIQIQANSGLINDLRTLQKLTLHLSREYEVSFIGEPLQGLQIMGVLETRAIDIERVIYLSMNEGSLPQEDKSNTFIPYDLRNLYQLPNRSQNASIQAYNFYRSIQRAKSVHLILKDEGGSTKSGGHSRFIAQMEHELAGESNIEYSHKNVAQPAIKPALRKNGIDKSEQIIQRLKKLLESGLSPSAISTFIQCPLDFYYKYVLGIRAAEDAVEHLDVPGLGTVVHEAAEALFTPLIGKTITPGMLKNAKARIPEVVKKAFHKEHPHANLERGKDLLHFEIIKKFMNDYINQELVRSTKQDFQIEALERSMNSILEIEVNGEPIQLTIKGKADRIDRSADQVLLIDLKSGILKYNELKVNEYQDIIEKPQVKALQLLTYSYLLQKTNIGINNISAGIFPFGNSSKGIVLCELEGSISFSIEQLKRFEEIIAEVVTIMLDTNKPFAHNDLNEYCEFCT